MIPARKSKLFDALFHRYNSWMLWKHFATVRVAGSEYLTTPDRLMPVIGFGNHSSWWDGLIVHYLSHTLLDSDVYLMMEEKQLARYRFFSWLGAFSVRREDASLAAVSLRYAARLLDHPNRWLWIYPQGLMQPNDRRPLQFFPGAAMIARLTGRSVQLIPFAHRYEFLDEQQPDAFVRFGRPFIAQQPVDIEKTTQVMEHTVTDLLERLRADITTGELDDYQFALRGRLSTNKRYDRIRGLT